LGSIESLEEAHGCIQGTGDREPADYLVAVSGGSYLAGALTMLRSHYPRTPGAPTPPLSGKAFDAGSDEVEYLRRRARYLLGGDGGLTETVIQFVVRLALNLAFVALPIAILGRVVGWIYGDRLEQLPGGDVGPLRWPIIAGLALLGLALIVSIVRVLSRTALLGARRFVLGALTVGGVVLFVGLLPMVIADLTSCGSGVRGCQAEKTLTTATLGTASTVTEAPDSSAARTAILATIGAAITAALSFFTKAEPIITSATKLPLPRKILAKLGRGLLAVAAAVLAPLGLLALFAWMVQQGAQSHADADWEAVSTGVGLAIFLLLAYFGDPTAWSLHPFYKRRLMTAFCLERVSTPAVTDDAGGEGRLSVHERGYATGYLFSRWDLPERPELIVGAAANVSSPFGAAPAGQNVLPFSISAREIRFSNGRTLSPVPAMAPAAPELPTGEGAGFQMEELVAALENGGSWVRWNNGPRNLRNLTLPAAIAISGAAFSPSMGKFTIGRLRMLITLFNLRLGVWLPNPGNTQLRAEVAEGAITHAPSALYLLREYTGRNSSQRKFVYVSDGGHYENLGLVELLRRGCKEIWCIDASGDPPGEARTLAEAMRLAEIELDISWDAQTASTTFESLGIDADATEARGLPTIHSNHGTLAFKDRDGIHGRVHVVKTGITDATPAHLKDYQQHQKRFPYDSTGNQLFRADRFDAYCELGRHAASVASVDIAPSPVQV
jgi:hypothetical protein